MSESKTTVPDRDGSLLGIYAKSITPPPSGAVKGLIQSNRRKRFELLSRARSVLSAAGRRAGLTYGHDYYRTAKCKHVMRSQAVEVHHATAHNTAFFSGLATCGSVWACPICAAKIQERRREEIAKSVDWAYSEGLQPALVTLTFPHRSWHSLRQLLERQSDALQRLRGGSPWLRVRQWAGYKGLIRSLELTHGVNGWHPHTHELWFVRHDLDALELKERILERWQAACIRAGLLNPNNVDQVAAFRLHAVDVKGHCNASDYLAKQDDSRHWGVDRELAKASTKTGRSKGVHPFSFLAAPKDDTRAARLFVAYALAMRGKRQVFWSPGLKDDVGVSEVTDEELAEEEREEADTLGHFDRDEWHVVRMAGARADVLDAAELGRWPAVRVLLDRLIQAEIQRLEEVLRSLPPVVLTHAMRNERSDLSEAKSRSESSDKVVHCVARF